jgi:hypothetical protein
VPQRVLVVGWVAALDRHKRVRAPCCAQGS